MFIIVEKDTQKLCGIYDKAPIAYSKDLECIEVKYAPKYKEGYYFTYENGAFLEHKYTEQVLPYEQRVVARIRERYSIDDEIAILRQHDTKPEEFAEYNDFVEQIKSEEKNR